MIERSTVESFTLGVVFVIHSFILLIRNLCGCYPLAAPAPFLALDILDI